MGGGLCRQLPGPAAGHRRDGRHAAGAGPPAGPAARRRQCAGRAVRQQHLWRGAGVLVTAFWWVPGLGLVRTVAACAAVNHACAAGALLLARGAAPLQPSPAVPAALAVDSAGLLWRLAATGLLGIGYEVMEVRALSQVAENTVYTFAILLAVYLVGSALGAAAWQRWGSPRPASADQREGLCGRWPPQCCWARPACGGRCPCSKPPGKCWAAAWPARWRPRPCWR